jgi:uncharacterized protein YciI
MYIVLLRFSQNREKAREFMEDHNKWLKTGFDQGVFLLAGSIKPGLGGSIIARGVSLEELESRVNADPFVAEKVVTAEIIEIEPSKTDSRLQFLTER